MFCSNCGAKLAEDSLFCHKCGARVILSVEMPPADGEQAAPVPETEEASLLNTENTEENESPAEASETADDGDTAPAVEPETEPSPAEEEAADSIPSAEEPEAPAEETSADNEDAPSGEIQPEEASEPSGDPCPADETEAPAEELSFISAEETAEAAAEETTEAPAEEAQDAETDGSDPSGDQAPEEVPEKETTAPQEDADAPADTEEQEEAPSEEEVPSPAEGADEAAPADEPAEAPEDTAEEAAVPAEVPEEPAEEAPVSAPVKPVAPQITSRRPSGSAWAQPVPSAEPENTADTVPQKAPKARKKINLNSPFIKLIAAVLGVALVFGVLYYVVFNKIRSYIPVPDDTDGVPTDTTPAPAPVPAPVSQDLELGKKALEDKNYITAVTYLEKAYSADPKNVEAEDLLRRALSELQKKGAQDGDFAESEKYLLRMQELWQDQDGKLAEMYVEWLRSCAGDTDRSKGQDVLSRAKEYIDRSDTILYTYLFREPFDAEEYANRIAVFYGSDEPSFISMSVHYNRDFIASTLKELNVDELVINTEECEYPYVILRKQKGSGGYSVYYGELDDSGRRGGVGSFYTYTEDPVNPVIHYFTSRWTDNAPNGQFTEMIMSGEGFSDTEIYKGTVKNGYYQGTITITRDGTAYEGSYDNGKVIPIRKGEDGRTVVAEATDGSGLVLYASVENDSARYGLEDWQ